MSEHAKRIKRELVMKGTILDVYKDTMELPNGKTEEWDFVSHRKGAAAVVAVREDGKLLMVRQYRNALERMTLEIPAGARDSVTEDTKVCAARELELCEMIYAGKIQDSKTVSAILAYKNLLNKDSGKA